MTKTTFILVVFLFFLYISQSHAEFEKIRPIVIISYIQPSSGKVKHLTFQKDATIPDHSSLPFFYHILSSSNKIQLLLALGFAQYNPDGSFDQKKFNYDDLQDDLIHKKLLKKRDKAFVTIEEEDDNSPLDVIKKHKNLLTHTNLKVTIITHL